MSRDSSATRTGLLAVGCAASKAIRDGFKDQEIIEQARRFGDPDMHFEVVPLFQHGIPLLLPRPAPIVLPEEDPATAIALLPATF